MTALENVKVRQELNFYFWTGLVLYFLNTILYVIHLQQWKGWSFVDHGSMILFLALNVAIIMHVRGFSRWARHIFIVKFILFALVLYPHFVFAKSGGWVYSDHWPHGTLQRISNLGIVAYEGFFMFYLLRRPVRLVFHHP